MLIPLDVARHSEMISPFGFAKGDLDADGEACDAPCVRDVIRLKSAETPAREIARRVGTAPSTVRLTIRRFEATGLAWPLPDDITDTELEARLFASAGAGSAARGAIADRPSWTGLWCIANSGASK